MVAGRGEAGHFANRAVDVGDDTARPAYDVMMIVSDAPLEPGSTAGRLDPADKARGGKRVQGLVYGLQRDVTHPVADPRGDRLGIQVIAATHCLKQCDARGRDAQAGTAQLLGAGRSLGCGHGAKLTPVNTNDSRQRMVQG